ncbi:hypothetical protein B9Q19_04535 [Enterobacter bugandensis]|nr:hypothetical protein B9Q19_04535 [Enterobacter bugandensis]
MMRLWFLIMEMRQVQMLFLNHLDILQKHSFQLGTIQDMVIQRKPLWITIRQLVIMRYVITPLP